MNSDFIIRFKNQYLQQLSPQDLSYPPLDVLRRESTQQQLWTSIFCEDALNYPPPERYEARVLKELLQRIEESIVDPDEDVGLFHERLPTSDFFAYYTSILTYPVKYRH
jgi:hypothetical protein